MASKARKIILIILAVFLLIVLVIAILLWRAGLFAEPEISLDSRGPLHYVYVERTGPFREVPQGYKQADLLIEQQNIEVGLACGSFLDNPADVEQDKLRWRAGYLVTDSVFVEEPLHFLTIIEGLYLVASIKANPMVAPFKTYPAMTKWLSANAYTVVGPAYELYHEDGLIEVLFPVKPTNE